MSAMLFRALRAISVVVAGLAFAVCAQATEFKTVTIKVGYGPGGGYDQTSRIIARHIGRYLAGNPDIVVQNVPGGGSLKLTKMVLGSEPADGSVVAAVSEAMSYAPVLDPANANFDPLALQWIGSLVNEPAYCVTTKSSGIDTIDKFLQSDFLIGSTGKSSVTYIFAAMVKNGLNARFKVVTGFDGTADIQLAMQRGEIAGMCGVSSYNISGNRDTLNLIGTFGPGTVRGEEKLERFTARIEDPKVQEAATLIESTLHFHHPLVAPPGTPKDAVEAFRTAYGQMVKDPEFLADIGKLGEMSVNATSGEDISQLVWQQQAVGPDVFEAARNLVK
ncbi:Bug family tripartite tricarboxylate transporter substrate binding protein [Mesorhizobium sp.]|uniref:Bug family tripartite tricarboxylate transporter substrate binding protein n=1 Tax=Mesorhizobium sp. TaxID=1871066 RepID=UPI003566B549